MIRSAAGANPGPGWHGVPKRKPPTLNPVPVNPVPVFPVPDVQRAQSPATSRTVPACTAFSNRVNNWVQIKKLPAAAKADRCGALGNSARSIAKKNVIVVEEDIDSADGGEME